MLSIVYNIGSAFCGICISMDISRETNFRWVVSQKIQLQLHLKRDS